MMYNKISSRKRNLYPIVHSIKIVIIAIDEINQNRAFASDNLNMLRVPLASRKIRLKISKTAGCLSSDVLTFNFCWKIWKIEWLKYVCKNAWTYSYQRVCWNDVDDRESEWKITFLYNMTNRSIQFIHQPTTRIKILHRCFLYLFFWME